MKLLLYYFAISLCFNVYVYIYIYVNSKMNNAGLYLYPFIFQFCKKSCHTLYKIKFISCL